MNTETIVALQAISGTAAATAGLFFFGFWQDSRERLFLLFAGAFWLMACSWFVLAFVNPTDETLPYVYAVRLLAFLLIILGVVDKNRSRAN